MRRRVLINTVFEKVRYNYTTNYIRYSLIHKYI